MFDIVGVPFFFRPSSATDKFISIIITDNSDLDKFREERIIIVIIVPHGRASLTRRTCELRGICTRVRHSDKRYFVTIFDRPALGLYFRQHIVRVAYDFKTKVPSDMMDVDNVRRRGGFSNAYFFLFRTYL